MFGSQVLETATGLILMFFIIALGASSLTEAISRLLGKRSSNLEDAIKSLLVEGASDNNPTPGGKPLAELKTDLQKERRAHRQLSAQAESATTDSEREQLRIKVAEAEKSLTQAREVTLNHLSEHPWEWFSGTSIYESAQSATRGTITNAKRSPSYLSAKAFADAAIEMSADVSSASSDLDFTLLPGQLGVRVNTLVQEVGDDALQIKAGLERWFDDTMERLQGAYKRWVTSILFVLGMTVAIASNASTFHVAERLWQDPITREAVVAAADDLVVDSSALSPEDLPTVASTTDQLAQFGLPIGWDDAARETWSATNLRTRDGVIDSVAYLAGWTLTALLVTLGAPFWFDLLTRLSSLRSSGKKPTSAVSDPTSASSVLVATG